MSDVFEGTFDEVFNASVRAAQRNWPVTSIQRDMRMLAFAVPASSRTSAADCTVQFEPVAPGKVRVTLLASRKSRILSWGDDEEIASKLFTAIRQELRVEAKLQAD